MAETTVFVDDAVMGQLPPICAVDGVPTNDITQVRAAVGPGRGLGAAWLLLFLGPIGWIALAIMAPFASTGGEELIVQIPMGEPAYQELRDLRRRHRLGSWTVGVGLVGAFAFLLTSVGTTGLMERALFGLVLAGIVAGGITAGRAQRQLKRGAVQVHLDASRRWVTLSPVDPTFAAACDAQRESHRQRT